MTTREASPLPLRGILWRTANRGKMAHARLLPAAALGDLIEHYWFVRWDLRGEEPFLQETLPHPSVHWVTELGDSMIHGVPSRRFTRLLAGKQRVFGVKFKPGGFYPFFRSPVASFADKALTLAAAFGPDGAELQRTLAALDRADAATDGLGANAAPDANDANDANDAREPNDAQEPNDATDSPDANDANDANDPNDANDANDAQDSYGAQNSNDSSGAGSNSAAADNQMMDVAERFLLARLPPPDAQLPVVQAMVREIMTQREIVKVDDLARRFGTHQRALQRLFRQYVGASPKWVIQRYRLHEAVELAAAGGKASWSRLAADLGYFDQTHFAKDFKALVGKLPSEYARLQGAASAKDSKDSKDSKAQSAKSPKAPQAARQEP